MKNAFQVLLHAIQDTSSFPPPPPVRSTFLAPLFSVLLHIQPRFVARSLVGRGISYVGEIKKVPVDRGKKVISSSPLSMLVKR
jgi:hypothetical protein